MWREKGKVALHWLEFADDGGCQHVDVRIVENGGIEESCLSSVLIRRFANNRSWSICLRCLAFESADASYLWRGGGWELLPAGGVGAGRAQIDAHWGRLRG